ncbi:hypothetical protein BKA67DRAFT_527335 [Truncatella angustata]|uniref:Integral membrane protein TmpA n=1 Tax=Truncatella angustata TaxID=152316 RepID=A0A9P8RF70_9PEZI|nr:uncharacterized protein BKA67DRAFT_527335 [Truncatella angustata]KAH6644904.1 hypothetical protein BKA67DRAFT_527335 [Truncatella angustata]
MQSTVHDLGTLCINMAAGNAMVCTAIRSPLIINGLFMVFGAIPRSAPLWIRRRAAKIYHFGGVHKGTGIASCVWMVVFVILFSFVLLSPTGPRNRVLPAAIFTTSISITFVLIVVATVAHPYIRRRYHDIFELTHRFGGWVALVLLWVALLLQAQNEVVQGSASSMCIYLLTFPTFWFLLVATVAAIWPWTMLRHVEVKSEKLSSHATRLHFRHCETAWGRGLSLARHPLRDWHSFASFTDRFDEPGYNFSCLVSNAGDWTKSVIHDEPTRLWVRAVPVHGVAYAMKLFKRILVVTTGSGIGPCLSFIGYDQMPAMRVVWQTRSPLQTYGKRTLDLVRRLDANPIILDTNVYGRVDMLAMVREMAGEFQAEAVIVISNPGVTKRLVYNLELIGIPAFGPIFDS